MKLAGFKFRYETMLKLRKHNQTDKERALGRRVSDLIDAGDKLQRVDTQIQRHYRAIRQTVKGGTVDVRNLVDNRIHLNSLNHARLQQSIDLTAVQNRVDEARQELAEAKKQTDIMKKLRQNTKDRFDRDQKKKETAELDDLAGVKYAWAQQRSAVG